MQERKELIVAGQLIPYFDLGEGPPLVLLSGFGESAKSFLRLGKILQTKFRVILPETPGFASSPKMALEEYTLERQADRLFRFLDQLGLSQVLLGGNSSGGNLAVAMALQQPKRVQRLALLCPQGIQTPDYLPYRTKPNRVETILDFDHMMAQLYHQPPPLAEDRKWDLIHKMGTNFDWLNQVREVIRGGQYAVLNEHLPRLFQPTIILWGESDGRIPSSLGPIFAALCPKAHLVMLPSVGHVPQLEAPQLTAELLIPYLQSLD